MVGTRRDVKSQFNKKEPTLKKIPILQLVLLLKLDPNLKKKLKCQNRPKGMVGIKKNLTDLSKN